MAVKVLVSVDGREEIWWNVQSIIESHSYPIPYTYRREGFKVVVDSWVNSISPLPVIIDEHGVEHTVLAYKVLDE